VVRGLPARHAEGHVVRWYVLITDIHESKKNHEKLERSEAFLVQGQRISQTGTFGWSVASGELYWSEEIYRILECDRAAGATFDIAFDRVHPSDQDFVRQTLNDAAKERADFDIELRLLMPSGRVKHVHIIGCAVQSSSGNLDFVGAATDITAAKKAEEKIRRSEKEASPRPFASAHHRIRARRSRPLQLIGRRWIITALLWRNGRTLACSRCCILRTPKS
jgi:PAS domain S-box-containing protein